MASKLRIVGFLGVVLLLIGGTGFAWGSYAQATDSCESGHLLQIESLEAGETPDSSYRRVSFDNLSPVEQRIFLEALTSEYKLSRTYESSDFGNVGQAVVTYRGEQYRTLPVVDDCPEVGTYSRFGGVLIALIGLGTLAIVTAWRHFTAP